MAARNEKLQKLNVGEPAAKGAAQHVQALRPFTAPLRAERRLRPNERISARTTRRALAEAKSAFSFTGRGNEFGSPDLCILLAVRNGATYLQEQMQSYHSQTFRGWALLASDDGSEDDSLAQLEAFKHAQPKGRVTVLRGPSKGYAQNFLSLIRATPRNVRYAALSDQDDVWMDDKLSRAVNALVRVPPGVPALYAARTMITSSDLQPVCPSPLFSREPGFHNALVQNIGGGNTMVLNRAALDLARIAASEAGDIVSHDWWLYQLITGVGGQVFYDASPVLYYRQHSNNQVGSNHSLMARLVRIGRVMNGRFRRWNAANLASLDHSAHRLTPEARASLKAYREARGLGLFKRLAALRRSGVYRQGRMDNLALLLACMTRRL